MKTIGLLAGMTWESSNEYYRLLNEGIQKELGGLHSAKILMDSVDFTEIYELMQLGSWDEIGLLLSNKAVNLQKIGADAIAICTNTIHKVSKVIQDKITIPLISMPEAVAEYCNRLNIQNAALLGTNFTMEETFYPKTLSKFNIKTIVPSVADRKLIDSIIFNELGQGKFEDSSKTQILKIIQESIDVGVEAIILGCTELPMLIKPSDCAIPLVDTMQVHVDKILQFLLHSD